MDAKTDRELLELAAKAAGLQFAINGDDLPGYVAASNGDWRYGWVYWNPLTDDGDALRLAVKLGIGTIHHQGWGQVFHPSLEHRKDFLYEHDSIEATRRAIVRAAAEIGESK